MTTESTPAEKDLDLCQSLLRRWLDTNRRSSKGGVPTKELTNLTEETKDALNRA